MGRLRGPAGPAAVLALQRLAGNAAVAGAVRPATVQRCGGEVHPGCSCAEEKKKPQEFMQAQPLAVQRDKIDFRQLTWSDFKGPKPAKFPAATASGIRPTAKLKQATDVTDTGTDCTPPKAKQKVTEFTVKISVGPTMFDGVKAFFSQEESGADPDAKKGFTAVTAKAVKSCQQGFDKQLAEFKAQAAKDCQHQVGACEAAFKSGSTSFDLTVGGTTVTARSAKDCSTSLVTSCKAAQLAGFAPGAFTFGQPDVGSATAADKTDCGTTFKASVLRIEKAESERLLHHEQVHFNVTNSIATKLQADLRSAVAGMTVQVTECGKAKAVASAAKAFAALGAAATLQKMVSDARKELATTQKNYDTTTNHGLIQMEQDKWNKKFP
jgi:hypothetical protein